MLLHDHPTLADEADVEVWADEEDGALEAVPAVDEAEWSVDCAAALWIDELATPDGAGECAEQAPDARAISA